MLNLAGCLDDQRTLGSEVRSPLPTDRPLKVSRSIDPFAGGWASQENGISNFFSTGLWQPRRGHADLNEGKSATSNELAYPRTLEQRQARRPQASEAAASLAQMAARGATGSPALAAVVRERQAPTDKVGDAPHTNNFGLGDGGRYQTNVWDYAGVNTMKKDRMDELGMHPTVKPVALVADAILDVSKRGALVLDPFGGSGTTLIAAEKTGRVARLIEFDPLYCDVIVRRYQAYTGKRATLAATGEAFEDVAE